MGMQILSQMIRSHQAKRWLNGNDHAALCTREKEENGTKNPKHIDRPIEQYVLHYNSTYVKWRYENIQRYILHMHCTPINKTKNPFNDK